MYIQTLHSADIVHDKTKLGAYEWWYFDALDDNAEYGLVIIFYEGNPFSPRYNRKWQIGGKATSSDYPAISISIYHYGKPVYYSFTEFESNDSFFSTNPFEVGIGDHKLNKEVTEDTLIYKLSLSEFLPSGDALTGCLTFSSSLTDEKLGREMNKDQEGGDDSEKAKHNWILVQPRADVSGTLVLYQNNTQKEIKFSGSGYHDHNIGHEPMHKEFDHWYWGRMHVEGGTIVYYLMNKGTELDSRAWLIRMDTKNKGDIEEAESVRLEDYQWSVFGLKSARRVNLIFEDISATLRLHTLVDNGPFYQRFKSEGVIHSGLNQRIERKAGYAEYIKPSRIQWRIFWPLIGMRLRYGRLASNPVQKSSRLYRLTW